MEGKSVERAVMVETKAWHWVLEMSESERIHLVRLLRLLRVDDLSQNDQVNRTLFLMNLNVTP